MTTPRFLAGSGLLGRPGPSGAGLLRRCSLGRRRPLGGCPLGGCALGDHLAGRDLPGRSLLGDDLAGRRLLGRSPLGGRRALRRRLRCHLARRRPLGGCLGRGAPRRRLASRSALGRCLLGGGDALGGCLLGGGDASSWRRRLLGGQQLRALARCLAWPLRQRLAGAPWWRPAWPSSWLQLRPLGGCLLGRRAWPSSWRRRRAWPVPWQPEPAWPRWPSWQGTQHASLWPTRSPSSSPVCLQRQSSCWARCPRCRPSLCSRSWTGGPRWPTSSWRTWPPWPEPWPPWPEPWLPWQGPPSWRPPWR